MVSTLAKQSVVRPAASESPDQGWVESHGYVKPQPRGCVVREGGTKNGQYGYAECYTRCSNHLLRKEVKVNPCGKPTPTQTLGGACVSVVRTFCLSLFGDKACLAAFAALQLIVARPWSETFAARV